MMRRDVETIAQAALQAVDPYRAVREYVQYDDTAAGRLLRIGNITFPNPIRRVIIGAFGKASAAMTTAIVDALVVPPHTTINTTNATPPPKIEISGICICKDGHVTDKQSVRLRANGVTVYEAAHPIPDARGVAASWQFYDLLMNNDDENQTTIKICCISGGGSALFCTPLCSLDDLRTTNEKLLGSGYDINQINTVRKRLEVGKGGGLAHTVDVALILSDVIGDPLDTIASGPTVVVESLSTTNDEEKREDISFVRELDLPDKVVEIILSKAGQKESSAAAAAAKYKQRRCHNILVGNNQKAVSAASEQARRLGYTVVSLGTEIRGEAAEIGRELVATASNYHPAAASAVSSSSLSLDKMAWIGGGETTVTLPPDHGLGGRNQELALSAAIALHEQQRQQQKDERGDEDLAASPFDLVVASIGTDGTDGPTDAAGAIVDEYTVGGNGQEAQRALLSHDAYPYLKQQKALYTVRAGTIRDPYFPFLPFFVSNAPLSIWRFVCAPLHG
jgi:glycerate 2-kinase